MYFSIIFSIIKISKLKVKNQNLILNYNLLSKIENKITLKYIFLQSCSNIRNYSKVFKSCIIMHIITLNKLRCKQYL